MPCGATRPVDNCPGTWNGRGIGICEWIAKQSEEDRVDRRICVGSGAGKSGSVDKDVGECVRRPARQHADRCRSVENLDVGSLGTCHTFRVRVQCRIFALLYSFLCQFIYYWSGYCEVVYAPACPQCTENAVCATNRAAAACGVNAHVMIKGPGGSRTGLLGPAGGNPVPRRRRKRMGLLGRAHRAQ